MEEVPSSPNLHQEPPTPAVSDEDREGEEEDATTFMQKHAEKVLRATVSDQQKTGYLFISASAISRVVKMDQLFQNSPSKLPFKTF